jgi:putative PIN family toxin of toxin-antitoxin system
MITAILDTNIFVQAAIGSSRGASSRVLKAFDLDKYRLVFSPETLDELLVVLCVPHIRARHGWTDDQILRFILSFLPNSNIYPGKKLISPAVTRDVTDAKLLGLAEEAGADFLVINDRRHLLRVRRYRQTRIVTPSQFLAKLP